MSYTNAGKLSDDDIQALIAYIRSQPAAGQETVNPPDRLNLLGVIMLGAGMLPGGKPVFTGVITAPQKGPTVQYGEYVLSYQDCRECHGANLAGGLAVADESLSDIPTNGLPAVDIRNWRTGVIPAP
jgi:mono/diheme cytochrome c family protein